MGVISPILGLLAMSRDSCGYHNLGSVSGSWWIVVGDAAECPTVHGELPTAKSYPVQGRLGG